MALGDVLDYGYDNNTDVVIEGPLRSRQRATLIGTSPLRISGEHTEAFGALRTAQFTPTTGWTFAYNINAGLINTTVVGGGAVNHSTNFAVLTTGTDSAGSARINTRRGSRYIPGVGGLARFTAVFTSGVANSTQYIGQIDGGDGWAFGYNGAQFGILRRSLGVDTWVPQSEWNVDPRPDLDPTNGNVFQIEYRWLGFGAQYFSIEDERGNLALVHVIYYAGLNTVTSIDNPNLPLSAHVENAGNTTNITLRTPSAIAGLDGDPVNDAISVTLATDVADKAITAGVETPVLVLDNPATWLTKSNHMFVQALRLTFATDGTKSVTFRVYANATVVGGTFADVATNVSPIRVNKTATSFTGGTQVGT